jgi:hypothetical protein
MGLFYCICIWDHNSIQTKVFSGLKQFSSIIKRLVGAVDFRGRCLPLAAWDGLVLMGLDDQKNRKRGREGFRSSSP